MVLIKTFLYGVAIFFIMVVYSSFARNKKLV